MAKDICNHMLAAMEDANRLALEISLCTGLRIGDCLAIKTERLRKGMILSGEDKHIAGCRMTIKAEKTGKSKRIYLPAKLAHDLYAQSGRYWVFEGRTNPTKHRTRQAVYKDLKRVARLWRLPDNLVIAPHTMRKVYAVGQYQRTGDLHKVQELLQHTDEAVTILYAYADIVTAKKESKRHA